MSAVVAIAEPSPLRAKHAGAVLTLRDDLSRLAIRLRTMRDTFEDVSRPWRELNSAWCDACVALGGANSLVADIGALAITGQAEHAGRVMQGEEMELHPLNLESGGRTSPAEQPIVDRKRLAANDRD